MARFDQFLEESNQQVEQSRTSSTSVEKVLPTKTDGSYKSIKIPTDTYRLLKKYQEQHGLALTWIVDKLVREGLEKTDQKVEISN